MKKEKILSGLLPVVSIAVILILWSVAAAAVGSDYVLPSIPEVLKSAILLLGNGKFYISLLGTLWRTAAAFTLSFAIALAAAYFSKKSGVFKRLVSPVIRIIRALPTIAVVLLLLFWTNSLIAPVIVTMLVVLPTTYNSVYEAIESVDPEIIEMCRFYKVPQKRIFFKVVLPGIAPSALSSAGAGFSLNLKLMVAAEVLCSTAKSLGNMLNSAKYDAEISAMIALVLFSVLLSLAVEGVFSLLSKRAGRWK